MTLRTVLAAAAAIATLGVAAPATAAAPQVPDLGPTSFTETGPYAVGQRSMTLPSGAPVEVWYPARRADAQGKHVVRFDLVDWMPDFLKALVPEGTAVKYPTGGVRQVPVAHGRFPLVLFSHGYAGFRDQSVFLTAALASWGFVVAAPEHPSRNLTRVMGGPAGTTTDVQDLRATITLMAQKSRNARNPLHGHLDLTHIGAVGHSAGGRAVESLAAVDKRVTTFIGLAGASVGALDDGTAEVPDQPGLLMAGTADSIVELDGMEAAYAAMNGPKRMVELDNAGHLAFSDLCEIGADRGGLLSIAAIIGIPVSPSLVALATDGCLAPDLPATDAWPAIRQVVIAQLRHVFGIDGSDAGLTGLEEAFPGVVAESLATPRSASPRG